MNIEIRGITQSTIIGCNQDERINEQNVIIDLIISLYEASYLANDEINNTINYDEIIDFVKNLVKQVDYYLLETLNQYLANKILEQYPKISKINISIIKPNISGIKAREIKIQNEYYREFEVAIALGANLNNPKSQIISAIELLAEDVSQIRVGGFYESKPYGGVAQANFINTAIVGKTRLSPNILFKKLKLIEKLLGKSEIIQNGPRVIDLDLIFYDSWIYQYNFLQIPHPATHLRDFVMQPLIDIDATIDHPKYKQSLQLLMEQLTDRFIIKQL